MFQKKSRVVSNERLNAYYWRLTLEAPQIASEIRPGQFINVKISDANDPLFKRPFSVFKCLRLNKGALGVEVIYKIVGRGTNRMSNLGTGDELDVIGPLGHGFELCPDKSAHILLAGGMGSAGLFMLGQQISKGVKKNGLKLYTLLGAETKEALILETEFATLNGKVLVSTNDGTYGYKGSVTEMLGDAIDKGTISSDCAVYACGPEPMYKELAGTCREYNISAQVSMERHMMCGMGACLACVCKVDRNGVLRHRDLKSSHIQFVPEEEFGHALVCKDGPVFHIEEVILDE